MQKTKALGTRDAEGPGMAPSGTDGLPTENAPTSKAAASRHEPPFDWRALLAVHPAAELFPPLPEAELRELAEDIHINGLRVPVVTWSAKESDEPVLLDGVHRLSALALLGLLYETSDRRLGLKGWTGVTWAKLSDVRMECQHVVGGDPTALALSLNAHRRHLTPDLKRGLIAKVLEAKPELSDRAIGRLTKSDHKTVGDVRSKANGEIPHKPADEANAQIAHKPDRVEASGRKARGCKPAESPKPKRKEVNAEDIALNEFNSHMLRLLQMTKNKPERFIKTSIIPDELERLGEFLINVAMAKRPGAS